MSVRLSAVRYASGDVGGAAVLPFARPTGAGGAAALTDQYELQETVAEDATGRTWRALQRATGRAVAIRLLTAPREGEESEARNQRFLQQAAQSALLKHPNTALTLDFGAATAGQSSTLYVASEWVSGRNLSEALRAQGPMELRRALRVAIEVCRSLEEAHPLGVVHGDLQPAHVLLYRQDGHEVVKVAGYGVGDLFDELHHARDAASGPASPAAYRAPESIRHMALDGRADLYSVGALLYLMVTGQAPFARDTVMATLMAHLVEPVPSLGERASREIPEAVEAIVRRCLEKSPRERFPNATALREALEAALRAAPLPARAPQAASHSIAEIDVLDGVRSVAVNGPLVDLTGQPEAARRPLDAIRLHLAARDTGCLTIVVSERASYRVFFMQGELVAVHGPGDALATLRRLIGGGSVAPARLSALSAELVAGSALDAALNGEVPDPVIEEAMLAQIRQNAVSVAGLTGGALRWRVLDAVVAPDFAGLVGAVLPLSSAEAPAPAAVLPAPPPVALAAGPGAGLTPAPPASGEPPHGAPPSARGGGRSSLPWALLALVTALALWLGLRAAPSTPSAPETSVSVSPAPASAAPSPAPSPVIAAPEAAAPASAAPPAPAASAGPARPVSTKAPPASAPAPAPRTVAPAPEASPAATSAPKAAAPALPTAPTSDLKDPFAGTR